LHGECMPGFLGKNEDALTGQREYLLSCMNILHFI
jgi:hypothetical protein